MAVSPHSVGEGKIIKSPGPPSARVSPRPAWRREKEGMNTHNTKEGRKTKSGSDTFYELSKLTDVTEVIFSSKR